MWATPVANLSIAASLAAAYKEALRLHPRGQWTLNTQVAELIYKHTGLTPDGLSDTMAKGVGLNPEFVCWLMGFPSVWESCAPMGMPSSRKKRQKS
jgi:hypothetical protein